MGQWKDPSWINSLRPRQNGRHFPDDIFKCIFLFGNVCIWIMISLKFIPKVRINNIPALVQIMAWRRLGDKPLSEPMVVSLLTHICVTRPQWVKRNKNCVYGRYKYKKQKLQKSCSRCNKNTRHIESSYILQPPKYLLLFVNRFRYLNNNIIKDRCPIPLDATVMLGPLKFNLQATIDHHGPSIDSGHYTASINCCKKTFYCNDHKITEFGITDKNSSTAYIVLYKWIDTWFLDSNRRVGVWSLPWRWHILSIPLTTGRGTSAETCGLDDVFPPDDLGSRPETLC